MNRFRSLIEVAMKQRNLSAEQVLALAGVDVHKESFTDDEKRLLAQILLLRVDNVLLLPEEYGQIQTSTHKKLPDTLLQSLITAADFEDADLG